MAEEKRLRHLAFAASDFAIFKPIAQKNGTARLISEYNPASGQNPVAIRAVRNSLRF
jgi:hypothetical protein